MRRGDGPVSSSRSIERCRRRVVSLAAQSSRTLMLPTDPPYSLFFKSSPLPLPPLPAFPLALVLAAATAAVSGTASTAFFTIVPGPVRERRSTQEGRYGP